MRLARFALALLIASAVPVAAQDFDATLDAALAKWRLATWYLHSDNAALAGVEVNELRDRWTAFGARFAERPGEPYDRDPSWPPTVREVGRLATKAVDELDRDDVDGATQTLAQIGSALAASRARASATGFSDLVERYRREMDRFGAAIMAGTMDEAHRARLKASIAPLADAVSALMPAAPSLHRDEPEFQSLVRQNAGAVANLAAGLERPARPGLDAEVLGLWNVVRANYWLLFMRYG